VTTGANGANERQAMIDLLFALGQFAQADPLVERFGEVRQRHRLSRPDSRPEFRKATEDAVILTGPESFFLAIQL
jgi:hypothetical protein